MEPNRDALDHLLKQMGDPGKPLRPSSLRELTDLHGERLERFGAAYRAMPVTRRRRLVRSLVEQSKSNFEVCFDAIFRSCLQDTDAAVRALAVEGLGEDTSHALISPLLRMLRSDPSPRVRAAAAAGLGRFVLAGQLEELDAPAEKRIVGELLTTVNLSEEALDVRRRALESASYAGSPDVSEALELAYEQGNEDLRLSAVLGMGRSCEPRWGPILLHELKSSEVGMRYQAILACGELGLEDSIPHLAVMLRDRDPHIVEATVWALGQIGGAEARDLLLEAYEYSDEETQIAIDDALAEQALSTGILALDLSDEDDADGADGLYEGEEPDDATRLPDGPPEADWGT